YEKLKSEDAIQVQTEQIVERLELLWINKGSMKYLTGFMRKECERRRSSEIGIIDENRLFQY
ncbi:MAG: hypothetical protein ACI4DS_07285, partial [Eubacterium sp.]